VRLSATLQAVEPRVRYRGKDVPHGHIAEQDHQRGLARIAEVLGRNGNAPLACPLDLGTDSRLCYTVDESSDAAYIEQGRQRH
jgi:hypothetical protein